MFLKKNYHFSCKPINIKIIRFLKQQFIYFIIGNVFKLIEDAKRKINTHHRRRPLRRTWEFLWHFTRTNSMEFCSFTFSADSTILILFYVSKLTLQVSDNSQSHHPKTWQTTFQAAFLTEWLMSCYSHTDRTCACERFEKKKNWKIEIIAVRVCKNKAKNRSEEKLKANTENFYSELVVERSGLYYYLSRFLCVILSRKSNDVLIQFNNEYHEKVLTAIPSRSFQL